MCHRYTSQLPPQYSGTVNDVLLAAVTGGLREWLVARGDPVEGLILRAFIPVSQRARSSNRDGGNRLSGYLCELPVGEPVPGKRLLTHPAGDGAEQGHRGRQRPWRDTGVGRSVATSSGLGGGPGCRPGRLFAVRPDGAQHPDQAGFGWTPVTLCVRLGYPSANFRRFSGGLPGIGLS
jgi:hypothetical protein